MLVGDPACELVALHLSPLQCAHEPLRAFLEAYGPDPAWATDWRRRATACVLLFPFDRDAAAQAPHLPAVGGVRTPEDLEEALWPRWP